MVNSTEPSSSLSFSSSSHLSNGTFGPTKSSSSLEPDPNLEIISLSKLSSNLEQLLIDPSCDYSDADIVVEGIPVGVNRCMLAVRSRFFHEYFQRVKGSTEKEGKPKYLIRDLLPYGKVGYEAFRVFLSYLYTAKLKPSPVEVSTCVDDFCVHDACRPAINFAVELMYASYIFQTPELVSLFQLVTQCVDRVARSDLDSISVEKELPDEIAKNIKLLRLQSQCDDDRKIEAVDPLHEKRIKRIHKALDSDDVELVKLLLSESEITLDEANALHYAVAYCDPKVVTEVLGLGLANVNHRNCRGYTVLHMAARRKEPSIIVSLLTKSASALELTLDGQSAVSICRRLTRPKDYHAKIEQGQEANKDRICIDVLEREMRRNPMAGDASISSEIVADDLHMKLLYLENRVAFARLFFPTEAKLAFDVAHAETISEFAGISASKGSTGNLRAVNLNETPIMQNKRLRTRIEALMKTVEMGRRYFPNCSEVLDKFMEDDLPDLFYLEKGTPVEQRIKRKRFMELKQDVQKAFHKDKVESSRSGLSSSSSSSSLKDCVNYKVGEDGVNYKKS
ncbi:BTB/POZ domain and ankyrin repeat-containing protein NPR1-like isoform X2 [Juglans regia]|uniref:BTB/POZ domain and ankyrin repeat-containing protein NPR1-like isoform X2 n=1 Tax=Juglans regia TaxID=51240 RepID=A0A6P9ED85_JUGRE|nr:BTB/POZ domain and ankyrin repeat-containing protein NPR1-like isoform X2 [Juglans regia]